MSDKNIIATEEDLHHLRRLLKSKGRLDGDGKQHLRELKNELDRAVIVPAEKIPPYVVTMHSRFQIKDLDTGRVSEFTLVYPGQADISQGKLSVLAPTGMALLGYKALDTIACRVPAGRKRFRIEQIVSQPQAGRAAEPVQLNAT